jgi:hypothetical protein
VFRLRSFQQLEAEISRTGFQNWIGANRAFQDDVLRYSLSGFSRPPLEQMLLQVNRTLKRNKVLDTGRAQGRTCLERRVPLRKAAVKVEQVRYYHRAVACQIVSSPVRAVLALE